MLSRNLAFQWQISVSLPKRGAVRGFVDKVIELFQKLPQSTPIGMGLIYAVLPHVKAALGQELPTGGVVDEEQVLN